MAETRGNPLALLELPRGVKPAELAGGFGLPMPRRSSGRIEESFRRRLAAAAARDADAAARRGGRAGRRSRAGVARGGALGVGADAARRRRRAGLVEFGGRVRFRHPAGAIAPCTGQRRRRSAERAHWRARRCDGSRRSIPTAAPGIARTRRRGSTRTSRPSSSVGGPRAGARRVGRRGGVPGARAGAHARAGTPRPARLAAAQGKHRAGARTRRCDSWPWPRAGPLDELQRARAELLAAQIAFAVTTAASAAAAAQGREAAGVARRRARPRDVPGRVRGGAVRRPARARQRRARGRRGGRWPRCGASARLAARVRSAAGRAGASSPRDGYAAGAPRLKRALSAFRDETMSDGDALRWLWLGVPHGRGPSGTTRAGTSSPSATCSSPARAGALVAAADRADRAPACSSSPAICGAATSLVAEAEPSTRRPAAMFDPRMAHPVAAWQGREAEASPLIDADRREVAPPRRGAVAGRDQSGRARCSSTASAGTTTRSPRPSRPSTDTLRARRVDVGAARARRGRRAHRHAERAAAPLRRLRRSAAPRAPTGLSASRRVRAR